MNLDVTIRLEKASDVGFLPLPGTKQPGFLYFGPGTDCIVLVRGREAAEALYEAARAIRDHFDPPVDVDAGEDATLAGEDSGGTPVPEAPTLHGTWEGENS